MTTAQSAAVAFLNQPRTVPPTSTSVNCQPYFCFTAAVTGSASGPSTTLAVARTSGAPSATRPRASQGRRVTSGKLRMRFTLPESLPVVNPAVPSPKGAIHTGDDTVEPSRLRVVIDT